MACRCLELAKVYTSLCISCRKILTEEEFYDLRFKKREQNA